jgi:tetratricopeptide (TPR) repeat protein
MRSDLHARRTPRATAFVSATLGVATLVLASAMSLWPVEAQAGLSQKVGVPLKAGLDAAAKGRYPEAIAKIREADAVGGKSSEEQFKINEAFCNVYTRKGEWGSAGAACEKGLNSGQLSGAAASQRVKSLASIYLSGGNRAKALEYANRYLKSTGGSDPDMQGLIGGINYQSGNYKAAINSTNSAIKAAQAAGRRVDQNWLYILLNSYIKLGDSEGVSRTSTNLVRLFPSQDNWKRLTVSLRKQVANDDSVAMHVYRLMHELNLMDRADIFAEAAIVGIQTDNPAEALKFMERGFTNKVLKDAPGSRDLRILADAKKRAAEQQAALPGLEAKAAAAPNGDASVKLAEAQLAFGQVDKAVASARQGLSKGTTLKDDAQLALGRALMAQKNDAEARKAFNAVTGKNAGAVAKLWAIRAGQ